MLRNPNYVYGPTQFYVPGNLNFGEFILEEILKSREKVAFINGITKEKLTYEQLAQQTVNLAVSLYHMGARKGQTVAICSENRIEFWGAVLGAVCTSATVTTVNPNYTKGEIKHVLNISKPKYVICSPQFYKSQEKNLRSHDFVKKIIIFGNERFNNTICYNDLVIPNGNNQILKDNVKFDEFQVAEVKGQEDVLFVLYSSGTTGLPKGVMLTHLNVILSCVRTTPQPEDVENAKLTITPWFHAMGLMTSLAFFFRRKFFVFLPKFEVDLYLKTIEEYKIKSATVVPPVLIAVCKSKTKYNLSSLAELFCGAAPLALHKDTLTDVKRVFPNVKTVYQGYGMTEATLSVTRDLGDEYTSKPGGVGFAAPGGTIKIVDIESRKPLGPNEPGEICIKGGLIMKGYIGKDRRDDFDDEGFFKTGDIGYYDEDKYFFIVDRLKELIKYKAFQVPPAEIEAVLLLHESVRDVGVVGIKHKTSGEVPVAYVVLQPGKSATEQELKDFVAERLSNPKHLRGGVRFCKEIPKNPSGKILRRVLKNMVKNEKSKL